MRERMRTGGAFHKLKVAVLGVLLPWCGLWAQDMRLAEILGRAGDDLPSAAFALVQGNGTVLGSAATGSMQPGRPYPLASVTKLFTGAVIYALADQGQLGLDDKVVQYLGSDVLAGLSVIDAKDYGDSVTVRELLSHTSGFADYWTEAPPGQKNLEKWRLEKDSAYNVQEALMLARRMPAHFVPGEEGKAWYSDTNYQLLGLLIEKVTGDRLAEAYRKYILNPLGLRHTRLIGKGDSMPEVAPVYNGATALRRPAFVASEWATGGMVSTNQDMGVFLRAYFTGGLFDPGHLRAITAWNSVQMGPVLYGTNLMRLGNLRGHSGSAGTVAYYCPEKKLYLVGTIGQYDPYKATRYAVEILEAYGCDTGVR